MPRIDENGAILRSDFDILYSVDVSRFLEKKKAGSAELTYLSWSYAWAEIAKRYPNAEYHVRSFYDHERKTSRPYLYDPQLGYEVWVDVTINGITHSMWLPVMDGANRAMKDHEYTYKVKNYKFQYAKYDPKTGQYVDKDGNVQEEYTTKTVEPATMTDINRTTMRCLVKCLAMFGLGLCIYSGEDVSEYTTEDINNIAENFLKAKRELAEYVDVRSPEFVNWACMKAGVVSVDENVLVNIPAEMKRVTALYTELAKTKKEEAKAKDVKKKKDA